MRIIDDNFLSLDHTFGCSHVKENVSKKSLRKREIINKDISGSDLTLWLNSRGERKGEKGDKRIIQHLKQSQLLLLHSIL